MTSRIDATHHHARVASLLLSLGNSVGENIVYIIKMSGKLLCGTKSTHTHTMIITMSGTGGGLSFSHQKGKIERTNLLHWPVASSLIRFVVRRTSTFPRSIVSRAETSGPRAGRWARVERTSSTACTFVSHARRPRKIRIDIKILINLGRATIDWDCVAHHRMKMYECDEMSTIGHVSKNRAVVAVSKAFIVPTMHHSITTMTLTESVEIN